MSFSLCGDEVNCARACTHVEGPTLEAQSSTLNAYASIFFCVGR